MANKENNAMLDERSVLLITGGGKGITAQCAIKLAENAGCRFILVGRSPVHAEEPEWASGMDLSEDLQKNAISYFKDKDEKISPKDLQREVNKVISNREILRTLSQIKAFGGQAVYISADVTNEQSLIPQIAQTVQELGPVTGVIHGAGNLADKLIENKSGKDFDLVVDTKVTGLDNILRAVDAEQLKFLVLFASVAGFFGNAGQSDYAVANEILNKSAHIIQKSLPNCRVISINWGPWDSGMVSPQLKKVFERRNIPLINSEEGVQTLVNELTGVQRKNPQIVVGSPIFAQNETNLSNRNITIIRRRMTLDENPFVKDHHIGPNPVLPATCASSWLIDSCESLNPGWKFYRMEDFKVLKGVTFDIGEQVYEMQLELLPDSKKVEKVYDTVITSQNGNNRKIFHYSGQVTLVKELPARPNHQIIRDLQLNSSESRKGSEFYRDGTLFHGPLFQGVQEVLLINEKNVVTRVSLPPIDFETQGQFSAQAANPFINDAVVQSLLIWTQDFYQTPCLPSRLHEWIQYRNVPFNELIWVILTVTYHNDHAVSGDILVLDESGDEFFHFTGLEGTISKQLSRYIGKKPN
ncbi:MAG TPA: SDR family NAD(P)-dependent oxidoreductase [Pelolinea sp.]|nr:SDR family NAD(P)-dependent oxidoreductase [Pelolinea sp.]